MSTIQHQTDCVLWNWDGVHVRKHFQDSYEGISLQCSVVTSKQDKSVTYHTFYL